MRACVRACVRVENKQVKNGEELLMIVLLYIVCGETLTPLSCACVCSVYVNTLQRPVLSCVSLVFFHCFTLVFVACFRAVEI